MDARQQRGLMIAATARIRRAKVGPVYTVPSQSMQGEYTVDMGRRRCSCPDFELRKLPCKHLFAVEYVMQRETVTTPEGETQVTECDVAVLAQRGPVGLHRIGNRFEALVAQLVVRALQPRLGVLEPGDRRFGIAGGARKRQPSQDRFSGGAP